MSLNGWLRNVQPDRALRFAVGGLRLALSACTTQQVRRGPEPGSSITLLLCIAMHLRCCCVSLLRSAGCTWAATRRLEQMLQPDGSSGLAR